jgi:hypothetical protein
MENYMQKLASYICVLLLAVCITACSSGSSSTTPVAIYDVPAVFASYSSLPNTHRGGAVQWGAISTSAKFSNYSVSTLAGTAGTAGFGNYSTTNGPPAIFNQPTDITTDGTDFYVTDYGNNLIRKITSAGVVSTLNCTTDGIIPIGFNRPSGITTDGTNLYVADTGTNTIKFINIATRVVTIIGSSTGVAGSVDSTDRTAALFNQPIGITTDGISLYATDFNNATVRRIDIATKAVSTLAGASGASGSSDGAPSDARFHLPSRITTDGVNLYLTDFYNRTIRKIEIKSGTVTTIAGATGPLGPDDGTADGIGTAARFYQPNGITTDGINLYVTDSYYSTIRKIVIATGAVTTMPIPGGTLHHPVGITTDGTSLFVADTYNLNKDETRSYSNSILKIK